MPIERSSLTKDQRKVLGVIENLPVPEDRLNPAEDADQAPVHEEQKEALTALGIEPTRSAKMAQSLIDFVEAAKGMKGEHEDMPQERAKKIRQFQKVYPRGTLIEGTYRAGRRWHTDYGKVLDWYARSFDAKAGTHHRIQEMTSRTSRQPLAPFQLIVLFRGGNIERVSLSNIKKIKDTPPDITTNSSPEGLRRLR